MSSNLEIIKICEYCNNEFIAKKTTSKTCSDDCAKRLYKLKKREEKINQTKLQTEIRRSPKTFITCEEIKLIQAKDCLTLEKTVILTQQFRSKLTHYFHCKLTHLFHSKLTHLLVH